jgi:hypothetical protein
MSDRAPGQMQTTEQQDSEQLPPFAEQMATQLGGLRGLIESSIPVVVFIVTNVLLGQVPGTDAANWPMRGVITDVLGPDAGKWPLKFAIGAAVLVAVVIAVLRYAQGRPIRFAINGLFGIALGAWLAWDSGEARAFYLPGIITNVLYAAGLVVSIFVRQPAVGWFWTVVANGGRNDWRDNARLVRTFSWLTALWAAVFAGKAIVQSALYAADLEIALGVARIAMGTPIFALLLAVSFWTIRKVRKEQELALS